MASDKKGKAGGSPTPGGQSRSEAGGVQRRVVDVQKVVGFSPAEHRGHWISRLLIDGESVGSKNLVVNHFTLLPGQRTYPGSHPDPFEEVYYILSGTGLLTLGGPDGERHEMRPHMTAFIPAGTVHELANTGDGPLEMLTMMPFHPVPGVNSVYDARKKEWGTSFREEG